MPLTDIMTLLAAVIATGAGSAFEPRSPKRTFQLTGLTTAGAGAVACNIEVSNDGVNWSVLQTISLVLAVSPVATDGFATEAPWRYVRGNVTSISGTNASATLTMGNGG